ncbi:hypothetical protein HF086_006864, partial [Spodoptera exigua]
MEIAISIAATCGVTVPAGAGAVIGAFAIHQSAAWGPKPDVFDPDRFLPERTKLWHAYYEEHHLIC